MFSSVKKRSGEFERFDKHKLQKSIAQAMKDVKHLDESVSVFHNVLKVLEKHPHIAPTTDYLKKLVEEVLLDMDLAQVAKEYALFDTKTQDTNHFKHFFHNEHTELSANAHTVLQKRYLRKDAQGKIIETPEQLFQRVAHHVACAEKKKDQNKWERAFYESLSSLDFLPNTPCLVNAGNPLGQLAACFVLDVPDSIEGIYDTLKDSALIFQSGGSVGYSFSALRAAGTLIESTHKNASGPLSFMEVFDKSCEVMKSGGVRRAAHMGVLRIDHPDIFSFITEKSHGRLQHFNVSVAVTDDFMHAVVHSQNYSLRDHNGKKVRDVNAREVFDFLCSNAWESGDPGLLFIDEINRKHSLRKIGKIEAVNPCGETVLLPNESCVVGSVNLKHMVHEKSVDWPKLAKTVALGVRFLDDVVAVNKYPTKEIERRCLAHRKIGLGVMGLADMLLALQIPYTSEKALHLAKELILFIRKYAEETSEKLAQEKGAFPQYKKSSLKKKRRNATVLSIAPTGSISLIAGCNSGIEPLFGVAYVREAFGGVELFESNSLFEQIARYRGFYSTKLMHTIAERGSVQGLKDVPKDVQALFATALDIPLERHVAMQAVFQSEVDNAVSKTINLPHDASIGDVKRAYMLAWKQKCKGITVYRYGSKDTQVLYLGQHLSTASKSTEMTKVHGDYSGGCIGGECPF
ncbi:adenosylcobalamin-dependent ribonucleoside-diphosphate reductase [Candidatus Woesearchaeota archaeon]|nr:adenosylcobalamin-dependent ribonucleoside-diphosphate reductase [Candidatus Woesearchaeota archaeon]